MYRTLVLTTAMVLLSSQQVWAYGSSSSAKACAKPKFSDFAPANNAEVAGNAEFTFVASAGTHPETIKVSIKDQPVALELQPKGSAFLVKGKLPDLPNPSFARIQISAVAGNNCEGSDVWLLKITQ